MNRGLVLGLFGLALATLPGLSTSASARTGYYSDHRDGYSGGYERGPFGGAAAYDRSYRGRDRRYYQDCRRSSGTTGLLAGGAGGAILGNVLGGGALGTVLGAVGGGILGKHLDEKHDTAQNYRNGC